MNFIRLAAPDKPLHVSPAHVRKLSLSGPRLPSGHDALVLLAQAAQRSDKM